MNILKPQRDYRNQMQHPITDCTFSVWRRESTLERRMLHTTNLEDALTTLEGLAGKKKFAYIYYAYKGSLHFLCCTLDGKWSRIDYREAVKKLLRKSRTFTYKPGLWGGKRSLT